VRQLPASRLWPWKDRWLTSRLCRPNRPGAGAIELPLRCAQEWDAAGLGAEYFEDGLPQGDPRQSAYERRLQCYECVFETLLVFDRLLDDESAGRQPRSTGASIFLRSNHLAASDPLTNSSMRSLRRPRQRRRDTPSERLQPGIVVDGSPLPPQPVRLASRAPADGSAARGASLALPGWGLVQIEMADMSLLIALEDPDAVHRAVPVERAAQPLAGRASLAVLRPQRALCPGGRCPSQPRAVDRVRHLPRSLPVQGLG
jgi:hypothetical protein